MRTQLRRAKFAPPRMPRVHIDRQQLIDSLDRSADVPLTTIAGPPGCGKTVALGAWVESRPDVRAVWMSCDRRDADPFTFWHSLTEGLHQRWPDAWLDVRELLQEDEPSLTDVALAAVEALEAVDEPVTLVIDDFHIARAASESMALVVEALPQTARVLIGTRSDPQLPLHRMRLRDELLEIRADDLRLTVDETAALVAALGVELGADSTQTLHERTEGWVAAVHLAALSLRGQDDPDEFLRTFSGENRLVAEFLVNEVLERNSELARRFLRESSVLEEMDATTCDAVTGMRNSDALLRELSADNMLVVPLRDGISYRYHHLFRDLLHFQLRAHDPDRYVELHQVSARFFETRGELVQAAEHLTLAGDEAAAFALLHDHALDLFVSGGAPALSRFVSALDLRGRNIDAARAADIVIALAHAGDTAEAERWITRVAAMSSEDPSVATRLAVARAMVAISAVDPEGCEAALAEISSDVAPDDPVIDSVPGLQLRSKLWTGDFAGSRAAFEAGTKNGRTPVAFREVLMPSGLSWTACVEGHLREADRLADAALAAADEFEIRRHPMLADGLRARGRVLHERGRLDEAELWLERAVAASEPSRRPGVILGAIALARLLTVQARFTEAAASIDHARSRLPAGSNGAFARLVDVCDARLALAAGHAALAEALVEGLGPSTVRSRLAAELYLATDEPELALDQVDGVQPVTPREVLGVQVLRARSMHALGKPDADDAVAATIDLAREEAFVIALVEGMPELTARVSSCLRSRAIGEFEQTVLDRLDRPMPKAAPSGQADLVEQLSPREQTVLRYLDSRLTVHEIASELYVSPNTLKTHVKAVYRKLGVSSRKEAVAEGRRLDLL